jgi:small-conductance mechanosensitive channel/CRP-like cAMP-binding protein
MPDLLAQPWFWPSLVVVIGLPIALVVLTEIAAVLTRRGNPAAKVIRLLRTFVVPTGALLVLLSQTRFLHVDVTWSRVVATIFGFLIILVLLNGLNLALFTGAAKGSWRARLPSIFVDIARLLIIIVSLALLFTWVWNADVGGLFTALGVSSIVIGLALQNAAGSVVSGLLLLFEQPFQLGDWLDAGDVRGRVIEVNWRAVHIDTGNGIRIVPTATLAGSSFTNLSTGTGSFLVATTVTFATDDAPQQVLALLRSVAADLPEVADGQRPEVLLLGNAQYSVRIPVRSPSDEESVLALFLVWLWYAARRARLHLDGDLSDDYQTAERIHSSVALVAPVLHLARDDVEAIAPRIVLERYGAGEVVQRAGEVPDGMRLLVSGTASLEIPLADGARLPIARLRDRDMLGLSAITREAVSTTAIAQTDVTVVFVPLPVLDELVGARPALAREIGQALDNRSRQSTEALAAAGLLAQDRRTLA